jgi:hypothetical protein|tara:strand:- start:353 stop:646 length:294 start_codon:yes stop_codon:yes gene_type:complete
MSIENAIFGKIIDFGLDAAGNLLGGGGDGGGNDPLLTALRMQRYAQAGKYISSVRMPEKPGTPPTTKMPKTESYLTYNKFWDEKLLSYYKLARTVAK